LGVGGGVALVVLTRDSMRPNDHPRACLFARCVLFFWQEGEWVSGFFDKGSFTEYLSGWARTVIVGRARLGASPLAPTHRGARCVVLLSAHAACPVDAAAESMTVGGCATPACTQAEFRWA
jgi:hypothetical protein